MPSDQVVDITTLLPTPTCIRSGVQRRAKAFKEQFRALSLQEMLQAGDAVTCDGLQLGITGAKYYDMTAHYFTFNDSGPFKPHREAKLMVRILFILHHEI